MKFIDCIIHLNKKVIEKIEWRNSSLENELHLELSSKIGSEISSIIDFSKSQINISKYTFNIDEVSLIEGKTMLLLSLAQDKEFLYMEALNIFAEGIQIYDDKANVIFFNKASKRLSKISEGLEVEGMHFKDFYDLDEKVSTVLSTLKNKSPVINRVDKFVTKTGNNLISSNSAYPIMRDGNLVGVVTSEHNLSILKSEFKRIQEIQNALRYQDNLSMVDLSIGYNFDDVIGKAPKLLEAVNLAKRVAPQRSNVLLIGETGTGKEIFAQSIHKSSNRMAKKFIAINCAAVPETLIESLLFGTVKHAFTGSTDKAGYFEEADGGTLFLDELNSMSLTMQAKILRVIQENSVRRVGGDKDIKIDVRIISSCNVDPFDAVKENLLRKDLFFRLSNVLIVIPPLREHIEDIEELIWYHLNENSSDFRSNITGIDEEALEILKAYDWPGNVRELFHVIDYMKNIFEIDKIKVEHIPKYILSGETMEQVDYMTTTLEEKGKFDFKNENLQSLLDSYECEILKQALDFCGYNITKTAELLHIKRQSLQYRIKKYGLVF